MENASKALIMAGEILVGMLVIGLIVYIVSLFGGFSANMNSKIEENNRTDFNSHFYKYEGRIDITADEIVSVINYAANHNLSYDYALNQGYNKDSSPFYVEVRVEGINNGKNVFQGINDTSGLTDLKNRILKENYLTLYRCNISYAGQGNTKDTKHILYREASKTNDIKVDDSVDGTGLVHSITFYKTNAGVDDINTNEVENILLTTQNRGDYTIQ